MSTQIDVLDNDVVPFYPVTPSVPYTDREILLRILAVLAGVADAGSDETASRTPHVALLGASASQVIPAGAKGWSFVVLTGTATVGGVASIPAGVGDQDNGVLAASLTITTAAASSAYVRWNT